MSDCRNLVETVLAIRGTNPCSNTVQSLLRAMDIADCCSSVGRDDLASELVRMVKEFSASKTDSVVARLNLHVSRSPVPPLWIRGWNFANAMARHAASGFTRCSNTTIEERLAVCQICPHLVDHHCQLCGCACIADNQLMNKLALVSEACPLGKWK